VRPHVCHRCPDVGNRGLPLTPDRILHERESAGNPESRQLEGRADPARLPKETGGARLQRARPSRTRGPPGGVAAGAGRPGQGAEGKVLGRHRARGRDRERHERPERHRPEGRLRPRGDRGEGRGDPPARRRHLDVEDGTREDAPDAERAGGFARGTREGGQTDLDRAHIPTPFVRDEGQVGRGTRSPPPGTREVVRLEAYVAAEEGKGAGAEGFGTPAERGAGRGDARWSRCDPDSRAEGMGEEDPREGEGTREAGSRTQDDGDPSQGAVRECDPNREAVPGSAEDVRRPRVGVRLPGEEDLRPGGGLAGAVHRNRTPGLGGRGGPASARRQDEEVRGTVQGHQDEGRGREGQLEEWERRLREREEDLKRRTYQKEKEMEMREGAVKARITTPAGEAEAEEAIAVEKKADRVKTGTPRLDDLLYGGIPFNS